MSSKILIYRYNSICEPSVIRAFKTIGLDVDEITAEMTDKSITPSQCLKLVNDKLSKENYAAVFSINFYPTISEVCQVHKIPYIAWTVDCPIMELYSDSLKNSYNRIFLFDHAQYEEFYPVNPDCIFYMPLAADTDEYDRRIKIFTSSANVSTLAKPKDFHSDVSFVGSLYSEKCSYNQTKNMPDYLKGYLDGMIKAQSTIYGYNFLTEVITEELALEYGKYGKMYHFPEKSTQNHITSLAHNVLSYKIAEVERTRLLKLISEKYSVDLYTYSDTSSLPKVHNKGGADTFTEMPLVFNQSKINLNFTLKAIQTGLPLRIWDIMGCGGFVLSNYQQEIPEYFEIGKEIEVFTSENELLEKIEYYLTHEEERKIIAQNGYEKVKEMHTWVNRIVRILNIVFP